jgi:hypothetical protein
VVSNLHVRGSVSKGLTKVVFNSPTKGLWWEAHLEWYLTRTLKGPLVRGPLEQYLTCTLEGPLVGGLLKQYLTHLLRVCGKGPA